MGHAADDRVAVGQSCQLWHVLTDQNAGYGGANRPEFALDFGGGVWLRVPRVELALAAVGEDENHGFGAAESGERSHGYGRSRRRHSRQAQAETCERTDL